MKPSSQQLLFDFNFQNEFVFENIVVSKRNLELLTLLQNKHLLNQSFYYLWGVEGAGKSHLLQALCQSDANAVYVPLKDFFEYGPDILLGLENMDLVCLDDVNCVVEKPAWEEALFHFYNVVQECRCQLFIGADCSSRQLNVALPDLASRLSWGVSYQLHELSDDEKTKALELRAKKRGIPLREEVLNYILLRSPRGMDNLFAVLDRLDQVSLREKRRITIPFMKALMGW